MAPSPVKYHIIQKNGTITEIAEIAPPEAEFKVNPVAGIIGTEFMFDASLSSDKSFALSELMFRWNFLEDDNWTSWSSNPKISYVYSVSGSYSVVLEVKNPNELNSTISHKINVGGGAGSASHVKVFMDVLPWDSEALYKVLNLLGFTEGPGPDQYEVFNSTQMKTVNLVPGEDLVIVSNDQTQNFYNSYARNQSKFATFLSNGGSILWEACDIGWAEGSISDAGIQLPGNVLIKSGYDWYNYVVNPLLPLVAGLPIQMDHNYASHESFYNLSDGTTVYCENSDKEPTLIEFNFNNGWIIFTGQPLEHQYDRIYGNKDVDELLPRIIAYFTGKEYNRPLYQSRPLMESLITTAQKDK
ncbi:MAG: PKD domain-containing protein [Bacteroidia bacterium]|nr:PKD domain-containing protein [Bacteroidia bacterium]